MTPQNTAAVLPDIQSNPDTRGIALQQVGVKNVEMPLQILQKDGKNQTVTASISMSVSLSEADKGTHLSRFIIQLTESYKAATFCYKLDDFLAQTRERLTTERAFITIDFKYFVDKPSPVTAMVAPWAVDCRFEASLTDEGVYNFVLGVDIPIATLCPCSKAISDYGAHNQRALLKTRLNLDTSAEHQVVWIEDLVKQLDECASCPVYPILKRADEKYVTERAYDNPKFVEDVAREAVAMLREIPSVKGFEVEVEALESIHGHNAWAMQSEGVI